MSEPRPRATGLLVATLCAVLAGCATTRAAPSDSDPWERMNRGTFAFNDAIDRAVLKPVARAYRRYVPQFMRTGVTNFLSNLAYTTTLANNVLQLKLKDAASDTGRLLLNSTLGIGGLLDPATDAGLPRNDEHFGQTLGRWGLFVQANMLNHSGMSPPSVLVLGWPLSSVTWPHRSHSTNGCPLRILKMGIKNSDR